MEDSVQVKARPYDSAHCPPKMTPDPHFPHFPHLPPQGERAAPTSAMGSGAQASGLAGARRSRITGSPFTLTVRRTPCRLCGLQSRQPLRVDLGPFRLCLTPVSQKPKLTPESRSADGNRPESLDSTGFGPPTPLMGTLSRERARSHDEVVTTAPWRSRRRAMQGARVVTEAMDRAREHEAGRERQPCPSADCGNRRGSRSSTAHGGQGASSLEAHPVRALRPANSSRRSGRPKRTLRAT